MGFSIIIAVLLLLIFQVQQIYSADLQTECASLPDHTEFINGTCLVFVHALKTRSDANNSCTHLGSGHLVYLIGGPMNPIAVQMNTFLTNASFIDAWVGLQFNFGANQWMWDDGTLEEEPLPALWAYANKPMPPPIPSTCARFQVGYNIFHDDCGRLLKSICQYDEIATTNTTSAYPVNTTVASNATTPTPTNTTVASNATTLINTTIAANATTSTNTTVASNTTTPTNTTVASNTTTLINTTMAANATTPTPSNTTIASNATTPTPSNTTIASNATTPTPSNTTIASNATTPTPSNTTIASNATTPTPSNTTTASNATTPTPSNTTIASNATTPTPSNTTIASNATTPTPSNTTIASNATTPTPSNTTTASNATTPTPSNTTIASNATTPTPSNTTIASNATTPTPSNTTIASNATTPTPSNTTIASNATTPTPVNTTIASNTTTPTPTNTTVASNTTTLTPTNTTVAPNTTTPINTTIAENVTSPVNTTTSTSTSTSTSTTTTITTTTTSTSTSTTSTTTTTPLPDCAALPNGNYGEYPPVSCSKKYYQCLSGVRYNRTCRNDMYFYSNSSSCTYVLACDCSKRYGGKYASETDSCFYRSNKFPANYKKNSWFGGFSDCTSRGRQQYWKKRIGRLAHVTTDQAAQIVDTLGSGFLGALKLDQNLTNSTNITEYKWYRTYGNRHSHKQITPVSSSVTNGYIMPASYEETECLVTNAATNKWEEGSCHLEQHYICEEFYNQCYHQSCSSPKVCVPDVLNQWECVCPPGTVGDSCETPEVIISCLMIDGYYDTNTDSCFKRNTGWDTWYGGWRSKCSSSPFHNFVSRLAHVRNSSVWDNLHQAINGTGPGYWLGHKTLEPSASEVVKWHWFTDSYNPNTKIPHTFLPFGINWTTPGMDCGYQTEDTKEWKDQQCWVNNYSYRKESYCEYLLNTCITENVICPERQVCAPDTRNTNRCVCKSPFTGPNCDQYDMESVCRLRGLPYNKTVNPYSCYDIRPYYSGLYSKINYCKTHKTHDVEIRFAHITNNLIQDYLMQRALAIPSINQTMLIGLASDTGIPHKTATWGKPKDNWDYTQPFEPGTNVSYEPPGGVIIDQPTATNKSYCGVLKADTGQWILRHCNDIYIISSLIACEVYVPTACDSAPCQHGGNCTAIFPNNYTCQCFPPFYGTNCEKSTICDLFIHPCLNGGTCLPTHPQGYKCDCVQPYYGYNCGQFCDENDWSDWSTCSKTCDYGYQSRGSQQHNETPPYLFELMNSKSNVHCFSRFEHKACNSFQCKTDWTFELHDQTNYYDDCMAKQGFYTGAGCYFLVQSTSPGGFKWDEMFNICPSNGAAVAHIYDTDELMKTLLNFLLYKHPDQKAWIPLRGYNWTYWMNSPSNQFTHALLSTDKPPFTPYCIAQGTRTMNSTKIVPYESDGMSCTSKDALNPVSYTICMIRTPFADFEIIRNHHMSVYNSQSTNLVLDIAESEWFCGLKCRYMASCISYNYQKLTKKCEMLKVKLGMETTIEQSGLTELIYKLDPDISWDYYKRRY